MLTPFNEARKNAFAKTVIMPDNPAHAQFMAETFLEKPKLVNNQRGVQGYTGSWHGIPISVMASGLGCPSMGIYAHELFNLYQVDNILRVGSAGALSSSLNLRDVVLAQGACTDSNYGHQFKLDGVFAPTASYGLLESAVAVFRSNGTRPIIGNILTSDVFYRSSADALPWNKLGVLALDLETAALYYEAAAAGKRALSILTITDSAVTGNRVPAAEHQSCITQALLLALATVAQFQSSPSAQL